MGTPRGLTVDERFWTKVKKTKTCWLWTASQQQGGYGMFGTLVDGKVVTTTAHRWAYQMLVGPIPQGMQLDHLCRVRRCVNPEHLEPVTALENVRRGWVARRRESAMPAVWRQAARKYPREPS